MRIRTIFFVIFIVILSAQSLHSAASQVVLPNGVWTLFGYRGIYAGSSEATNWEDDANRIIEDVADSALTYVVNNATATDHLYNSVGGASTTITLTNNDTTEIGANIGVFAIIGTTSVRGTTTLDGSTTSRVQMKFSTTYPKDLNIPM